MYSQSVSLFKKVKSCHLSFRPDINFFPVVQITLIYKQASIKLTIYYHPRWLCFLVSHLRSSCSLETEQLPLLTMILWIFSTWHGFDNCGLPFRTYISFSLICRHVSTALTRALFFITTDSVSTCAFLGQPATGRF